MLHSPYPHAEIVSIDTSEAEKLPGVIGVMTYKNAPAWKTGVPAHRPVMSQHLRFVGDPVAAVAAETPQIAEEALELIKVEYKELTPVYDVEDAIKDGAPEVYRAEDNIESKGYHYDHNCLPPGSWFEGDDPPFYKIQEATWPRVLQRVMWWWKARLPILGPSPALRRAPLWLPAGRMKAM